MTENLYSWKWRAEELRNSTIRVQISFAVDCNFLIFGRNPAVIEKSYQNREIPLKNTKSLPIFWNSLQDIASEIQNPSPNYDALNEKRLVTLKLSRKIRMIFLTVEIKICQFMSLFVCRCKLLTYTRKLLNRKTSLVIV